MTTQGMMFSKDPLRDRADDEIAIDLDTAAQLEFLAARLRSRIAGRIQLAQARQPAEPTPIARPEHNENATPDAPKVA